MRSNPILQDPKSFQMGRQFTMARAANIFVQVIRSRWRQACKPQLDFWKMYQNECYVEFYSSNKKLKFKFLLLSYSFILSNAIFSWA